MSPTQKRYQSFLLRMWRVKGNGDYWRASLENVETSELRGFSKLENLIDYLNALTRPEEQQIAAQIYQEDTN